MIIYLIRHGRSNANDSHLVTGTPTDSLSGEGKVQADRMALWIKDAKLFGERYFTSQWERAQQTAYRLWPEVDWQADTRIGETDAGEVADWALHDFEEKYPDFYANPANAYPGGESHLELNRRVLAWLYDQFTKPFSRLVAVTHAGPISCILQHILGMEMSSFPAFLPANASMSAIEIVRKNNSISGQLLTFSSGPLENLAITNK